MSRSGEQAYPVLSGLAIAAVSCLMMWRLGVPDRFRDLLGAALTVASITTGFLITASCTLLSSHESNWMMQRAKGGRAYRDLIEYIISAARWNFIAACASAIGLLVSPDSPAPWHSLPASLFIAVVVTAVLTTIRVFQILAVILRHTAD